jgi:hypothetical protein
MKKTEIKQIDVAANLVLKIANELAVCLKVLSPSFPIAETKSMIANQAGERGPISLDYETFRKFLPHVSHSSGFDREPSAIIEKLRDIRFVSGIVPNTLNSLVVVNGKLCIDQKTFDALYGIERQYIANEQFMGENI